jgi:hypothetical protein
MAVARAPTKTTHPSTTTPTSRDDRRTLWLRVWPRSETPLATARTLGPSSRSSISLCFSCKTLKQTRHKKYNISNDNATRITVTTKEKKNSEFGENNKDASANDSKNDTSDNNDKKQRMKVMTRCKTNYNNDNNQYSSRRITTRGRIKL